MKCQACGQAASTVHLTTFEGGKVHEVHLCEGCARGLNLGVPGYPPAPEVGQLKPGEAFRAEEYPDGACRACGHGNPSDWNFCVACGTMREP